MIQINETIQFEEGVELGLQNEAFQAWFEENIRPQIDFNATCTTRDEWQRPITWEFEEVVVKAIYFTENENYNFNKFVCYGTI
jgi:hypothetical protein